MVSNIHYSFSLNDGLDDLHEQQPIQENLRASRSLEDLGQRRVHFASGTKTYDGDTPPLLHQKPLLIIDADNNTKTLVFSKKPLSIRNVKKYFDDCSHPP